MPKQTSFFDDRDDTARRFRIYHRDNPLVYVKMVEFARQVVARGYRRYGIGAITERLRWHFNFEVNTTEEFKISNDFRAYYARLIMMQEADLAGLFLTKQSQADIDLGYEGKR